MKFTVNRQTLYEYLKSMIRVVSVNSPMLELRGFLMECNDDDGYLYITATNQESTIQRKLKVPIESGGSFVIKAHLLLSILDKLGEDTVRFEGYTSGQMRIQNGSTQFDLPVLEARNYPKPVLPFPDELVKISGICDLYTHTVHSVSSSKNQPGLAGIHLDIREDSVRAVAFNKTHMALSKKKLNCGGKLSLPSRSNLCFISQMRLQIRISWRSGLMRTPLYF